MTARPLLACALAVLLSAPPGSAAAQAGADPVRLYGRVTTRDGRMHEGFLRWGSNEAGWYDILHASKRIPERNREEAERLGWEPEERENRIEILGIGITLPGERVSISRTAQSGLRFGHLSSLERLGSRRARLVLKSGEEVELEDGGDLGSSLGRITVEEAGGGTVALEWSDLRAVDFMAGPPREPRSGRRLHGTLVTRSGDRFTGWIAWDVDEALTADVLDGEEGGRDREIPFSRIRAIAPNGSRSARVWLTDGSERVLDGTNDVNDDNRDILVADPALGEVRVEWDALDRVEFSRAPAGLDLPGLDGGRRLRGTVETTRGVRHAGYIRWDNDEEFTWELLDGELRDGVAMDIEFGRISAIERTGYRTSTVTLRDGRRFELGESNDVDEGNKGIYVEQADGGLVLVPWESFRRVAFDG